MYERYGAPFLGRGLLAARIFYGICEDTCAGPSSEVPRPHTRKCFLYSSVRDLGRNAECRLKYLHIRGVRVDAIRTGVMLTTPHDFAYLLDVVLDMLDTPSNHVFTKCDGPGNGTLPRVTIEDKLCPSPNGRKYGRANEPLLEFILDILGYWSQCVTLQLEWEQNGGIWQSPQAQIRDEYEQYMNGPEDWEDYEPLIFLGAYSSYATFVAGGLSIFCTEGGFVGLAPGETITGDQLFLVRGACLPVILRPAYDNMWTFRGFAYVHGIGQGQLVCIKPDHILEDEELVLC
ncbi:hypothetical protein LTR10_008176 [Elasticomyces elasticus]|nr:hypothetical protein LTR10_008176 [Elasticomyces elasticus]KAK4971973.1 hypothetical protein LTR42_006478 [Elasticomyces elasticus]